MKLYEINAELEALLEQVDPETGELTCDTKALAALMIAREEKLEGLALYVKNMDAEAAAIKAEEQTLAARRKALEKKAERTRDFLRESLAGETIKTARVAVTYRASNAVELAPEFMEWALVNDRYLRHEQPKPDKMALMAALKAGESIPGAELVERINMTIK